MVEFEFYITLFEQDERVHELFWAKDKLDAYAYLTQKYPTAINFEKIKP